MGSCVNNCKHQPQNNHIGLTNNPGRKSRKGKMKDLDELKNTYDSKIDDLIESNESKDPFESGSFGAALEFPDKKGNF